MKMKVERFVFGPFETNCYVVADEAGNILVIDPACFYPAEQQQLMEYISNLQSQISNFKFSLIATHGHLDHLWGAHDLCERFHASVYMHEADIPMAQAMQQQYDLFGIRQKAQPFPIEPLNKLQITNHKSQIISTPGHTPGSICLYFPEDKVLFSGDTLFHLGYGRTDLPGGNMMQLISSLEQLFTLPPDTRVYPGHGETTTIQINKR